MGFDTYLQIDDQVVLMWRKHAGSMPRLLFRFDDLEVDLDSDDEDAYVPGVTFRTSAAKARVNLEKAGLGWQASVAAYADTRVNGVASGVVFAQFMTAGKSAAEVLEFEEAFASLPADQDLASLG